VTGRPGPVVLDVPFDIFKEDTGATTPDPEGWSTNISCRAGADPEGVAKAAKLLMAADRPVILVGSGCRFGEASRRLLDLHLRQLAGYGVAAIFLEVDENNQPARRLYARAGFGEVGKRRDYYSGAGGVTAAALVLRRNLQ